MKHQDAINLFEALHPNFFESEWIRSMPETHIFSELILDLNQDPLSPPPYPCPEGIGFGIYQGGLAPLQEAVAMVDENWVQYFTPEKRIFCARDEEGKILSFCILDDLGIHRIDGNLQRIAGPGCVGTIPTHEGRGIGLNLVYRATLLFSEEGYDYSYIHYTYLPDWYAKLGYRTILTWNGKLGYLK